jgi:hypothetical protein
LASHFLAGLLTAGNGVPTDRDNAARRKAVQFKSILPYWSLGADRWVALLTQEFA